MKHIMLREYNISVLKNAEIVCSVDKYQLHLQHLQQCFKRRQRVILMQTNRVGLLKAHFCAFSRLAYGRGCS